MASEGNDTGPKATAEDAFSVLGDETRLQILLELAAVANEQGLGEGLTFSELRERVGITDSGRFNYHLDKLREGFIGKDDGEYIALYPGLAVVATVYAGTYTDGRGEHRADSPWTCPTCDRQLELRYEQHEFRLWCDEHETVIGFPAPAGAFNSRTLAELADVVVARAVTNIDLARRGICPRCWGVASIDYPSEFAHAPLEHLVGVELSCERCWLRYTTTMQTLVTSHPAVRGLYEERGMDLSEVLLGSMTTREQSVCRVDIDETEPVSATATVELGGTRLDLEFDETADVVSVTRQAATHE